MSGATSPHYPEKKTWANPSIPSQWMTSRLSTKGHPRKDEKLEQRLFTVDDTAEFHDPYSDLNLFLSQKIKHEMQSHGWIKKWSLKLQEALLEKIAPEFQKKFPHYRLGVTALRKTWEKIAYYTEQIEAEKGALEKDGKLSIPYLIRENLRQYPQLATISGFHPYQYAHQLALKISECIAVVDGIKPSMEILSRTVWAMQRHLLPLSTLQNAKSPYDEYDRVDKFIVKTILDITALKPHINSAHLEMEVKESIEELSLNTDFTSTDYLHANISSLVADKLYHVSPLHTKISPEEKKALLSFIEWHLHLKPSLSSFVDLTRRIFSLYLLAIGLPKTLSEKEVMQATEAVFHQMPLGKPNLSQTLFAFISAEMILVMGQGNPTLPEIQKRIHTAYLLACLLPHLSIADLDLFEIAVWKKLSENYDVFKKLPYRIGQKIESEIAIELIDNPKQNFGSLVHHTLQKLQKDKELIENKKPADIDKKIALWCRQGDLLCRCIRIDKELPLLKHIRSLYEEIEKTNQSISAEEFTSRICQNYLREHPSLICYAHHLSKRVYTLYKYAWYSLFSKPEESSTDRFILWHTSGMSNLSQEDYEKMMFSLFAQKIPLIPFTKPYPKTFL